VTKPASGANSLKFMQLGVNSSDMAGSLHFYNDVFGLINAGSTAAWGRIFEIQGLKNARAVTWWVIGKQELVRDAPILRRPDYAIDGKGFAGRYWAAAVINTFLSYRHP